VTCSIAQKSERQHGSLVFNTEHFEEVLWECFRPVAGIKYAQSAIEFIVDNNAPNTLIRCVMGLKKTRAFLVAREKPWWHTAKDGSSWWSGGVPKGKPSAFSGTLRSR
jgi:hypothetical protein